MDEALEGIFWTLSTNADIYPVLPGCRSIRAIRTDHFARPFGYLPVLRIYFRIISDDLVELAYIEEVI